MQRAIIAIILLLLLQITAYADINRDLINAARSGQLEAVKKLIADGADVNAKDENGWSALMHVANFSGDLEAAIVLIENGADVNAKDENGWSALKSANLFGHTEIAQLLISEGAKGTSSSGSTRGSQKSVYSQYAYSFITVSTFLGIFYGLILLFILKYGFQSFKTKKFIRYAVILWGITIMTMVIIPNFESLDLLLGQILFSGWNILPNFIFFIITKKMDKLSMILIPGSLLCSLQFFFVSIYFNSTSSTAALIFIFAPIYEGFTLILGFFVVMLTNYIIGKIKQSNHIVFRKKTNGF